MHRYGNQRINSKYRCERQEEQCPEESERLDALQQFLSPHQGFFKPNDMVSYSELEWLRWHNVSTTKLLTLFPPSPKVGNGHHYSIEIGCHECSSIFRFDNVCKSDAIELIKNRDWLCPQCERELEMEHEQQQEKLQKEQQDRLWEYANPDCETIDVRKFWLLQSVLPPKYSTLGSEFSEYLKGLPYKSFLQTPYWKTVASRVRANGQYRCALCGSKEQLNVHHKTYEHHGEEAHYLGDLILLCQNCHERFHEMGGVM